MRAVLADALGRSRVSYGTPRIPSMEAGASLMSGEQGGRGQLLREECGIQPAGLHGLALR